MNYKLRQQKSQQGVELLRKGIFPNELLEPIYTQVTLGHVKKHTKSF
jgi:hypothetical protein